MFFLYTCLNSVIQAGIDLEEQLAIALSVPFDKVNEEAESEPYVAMLQSLPSFKQGLAPFLPSSITFFCRGQLYFVIEYNQKCLGSESRRNVQPLSRRLVSSRCIKRVANISLLVPICQDKLGCSPDAPKRLLVKAKDTHHCGIALEVCAYILVPNLDQLTKTRLANWEDKNACREHG